ncbi:hypothetical protein ACFFJX_00005, partial [Pseudarcicella hirudinis]|uniref:hypothetical protein n=1 Tax=Pseudarcicella hirudinis TaxID=1079859 RepID=UPI0035E72BA6
FHTSNDTTRASLVSNATAVSGGTYYVFEISSSKCVSIGKPITVTITPCNCANPATIVISPVSPICAGGLINLTATKGGGASTLTWSTNGTGSFSTSTLSPTIYTPSQADITSGSVSFTVTTDDPDGQSTLCNAATAAVSVVINAKPVPVVIASRSNDCPSLTVDLNSSVTKSNAANTIEFHTSNDTTRASLVSNPASVTAGTYYVFEKSSAGCVSDGKPITVTITPCNCANPATIVISPVSPICAGGLINLVATKGGGASTLTWSTNGTGSFSTSTLSPTIYTPSQADITSGSVSFTVTTDDPDGQSTLCNAATAAVSVVINAKPVPVVIASRSNDCPSLTVDLNSSVTKSNAANTIEFHTSNDTTRASLVSNPASVTAGTYYVFEKSSAGCVSDGKPITVTITPCNCANPATIVISPVSPICAGGLINLVATKGGGASTLTWSTNGTGSFSTSTLSPTIYTPSQADITSGSVSFTVTTDDPDGQSTLCNAATAAVSVVINAKPVPVVIASRSNDCPSLTVDLNSSVTKSNAANTIEFHTSNDTTRASLVSNPASVTAGTYYVFEKSSAGCVSDGKPITVTITPCNCANPATIVISPVSPICAGGLINLVATKGGGASTLTWSTNGTGSFSTSTLSPTIYTPSQADITSGSVSFTVTTDDPDGQSTLCNAATAAVSVVINAKPVPVVIASRSNDCPSLTVDLNSSVTKSNAANTIEFHVSNDISSALVSNPASVTAGTYYVFEKSSAGCVSDGKPITVTITPCNCANPATIVISPVSPICAGGLINLVATKGGGASTLTWSTNGTGSFSTSTLSPTIYTPSQADITSGSVSFTVTTNDPDGQSTLCNAATAAVSVVINAKPVPVVIASRSNNCPSLTVDLNSSVTKSNAANTIEFHVSNDISSALVSNPASVTAGTYYVFEKSSAGCVSDGKPITVTITPCNCANPATIVISPVSPICAGGLINLTATKGGGANTLTWSTNGTGSFSTSTLSPTIYTPSQADITSGSVSFTVTTDDPDGQSTLCNAATATVSVVINKGRSC